MDASPTDINGKTGIHSRPLRISSRGDRVRSGDNRVRCCPGATEGGETTWSPTFLSVAVLVLLSLQQGDLSLPTCVQHFHFELGAAFPLPQPVTLRADVTTQQDAQILQTFLIPSSGPVRVGKPERSERYRHSLRMTLPSSHGAATSFASSAATPRGYSGFVKPHNAAFTPFTQRMHNGEEATQQKATHLRATTSWEDVAAAFVEQKELRHFPPLHRLSNLHTAGLVHLGQHDKRVSFRPLSRADVVKVNHSTRASKAEQIGVQDGTRSPSGSSSQHRDSAGEKGIARKAEEVFLSQESDCPPTKSQGTDKVVGGYLRVAYQGRQQHYPKRQVHMQRRQLPALSGVEIGVSSSLSSTTENTDEDDEDADGGDEDESEATDTEKRRRRRRKKKRRKRWRREREEEEEEEEGAAQGFRVIQEPPTAPPPAATVPPLPLPTPLGVAATLLGGAAKSALKLFGL